MNATHLSLLSQSIAQSFSREPYAAQVAVAEVVFGSLDSLTPENIRDPITAEEEQRLYKLLSSLDFTLPEEQGGKNRRVSEKELRVARDACLDALGGAHPCGEVHYFTRLSAPSSPLDLSFDNAREENDYNALLSKADGAEAVIGNLAFYKNNSRIHKAEGTNPPPQPSN